MRIALYARVSTRDKDQNPETQLYALRQYAEQRGWTVVKEYVDYASATDLRGRRAWRELLSQIRKGGIDIVLVLRLDRAFRSVGDTYDGLALLDSHKIGFVAATQPIDTTSAVGRFLLNILAALAEFEKDLTRERIHEGLDRAVAQGKKLGRPPGKKDGKPRKKSGYYARWSTR